MSDEERRCFSIELAYDGSDFYGWQIQPGLRTVQGVVQDWLRRILDQPLSLSGAGRTDTGVHALATLASFRALTRMPAAELKRALRRVLPEDILVRRVDERAANFSARHSARAREYEYRIHRGGNPFLRRRAWCTGYALDLARMRRALPPLSGRLDCRAFCVSKSLPPEAWCEFQLCELEEQGQEIRLRVRCDRFLHSMVRVLAGTLADIGRGRFPVERMSKILAAGDRSLCGVCAPPQGLYLVRVYYDDFATGEDVSAADESWTQGPPDSPSANRERQA